MDAGGIVVVALLIAIYVRAVRVLGRRGYRVPRGQQIAWYVGVALILRNVWAWLHWEVLSQPRRGGRRIDLGQLTFRGMLLWLQHYAEAWLGVKDEVHAQRPIPKWLMTFTAELR